jgi:hypothetical protein
MVRLAWIQFFKKSPINFRNFLCVPKGENAKGLGLFLSGYCALHRHEPGEEVLSHIKELSEKILSMAVAGYSGKCWGYNFDWQARAFFQPRGTPTVVATTFISYALLDAFDITGNRKCLDVARSACDFVLKDLGRAIDGEAGISFSYSPLDTTQVFNASLLGARLLSRVSSYTGEQELTKTAAKTVRWACRHQKANGSWSYSPLPYHEWIDSFHTGYNLECIAEYQKFSKDATFSDNLQRGLQYYLATFFTGDGKAKYYNNKLYPIDIHAPAQLVITLSRAGLLLQHRELVERVLLWTIDNMQDKKGYFYYQQNRFFTNRIAYMRWAQAWMFFALSTYLAETGKLINQ